MSSTELIPASGSRGPRWRRDRRVDGLSGRGTTVPYIPHLVSMGAVNQAAAVDLGRFVGASVSDIKALIRQVTLILLMDDSGSTFSWGTAMANQFGAAALSLTNLMGSSGGGTVYVGRYGSGLGQTWGPLDAKRQRKQITTALRTRVCLGGTNILSALIWAAGVRRQIPDEKTLVVIPITDGLQGVTSAIGDAISGLSAHACHMVLVSPHGGFVPEDQWRSAGMDVTTLSNFETAAMATTLGEILAHALSLQLEA